MRDQNWDKNLAEYIESQRKAAFVWGENDCILFAAKGADCITERDLMPEMQSYGAYDEQHAREILADHGGKIENIFDKHFKRRHNLSMIKRGDIAVIEYGGAEAAGIVDTSGRHVVCKTEKGLRFVPLKAVIAAWEVD